LNPLVINTAAARDVFAGFIALWVAIELISQIPVLRRRVSRTFDPTRLFVSISLVTASSWRSALRNIDCGCLGVAGRASPLGSDRRFGRGLADVVDRDPAASSPTTSRSNPDTAW
jgi:hypothetical protein